MIIFMMIMTIYILTITYYLVGRHPRDQIVVIIIYPFPFVNFPLQIQSHHLSHDLSHQTTNCYSSDA